MSREQLTYRSDSDYFLGAEYGSWQRKGRNVSTHGDSEY